MKYVYEFYFFLKYIVESKVLLVKLVRNDFKKQYFGSYLGITWAFVQPLIMVVVLWFVFEVGFRSAPITNGVPFILWLMCGVFPWYFFTNAFGNGTNAIRSNAFLVKKVSFRVSILPIVSVSSALIIHLIFIVILMILFLFNGYTPTVYWIQIPYYILCMYALSLGLVWLTSSINVFVKDIGNIVSIVLQVGFWATPIFWSVNMIPDKYKFIIMLNPMAYIINGYRDTFIDNIWFWERIDTSIYFIIMTLIFLATGALVFKRLRPHFGDVL